MPTPLSPNIVDRMIDYVMQKKPVGREREIVSAAALPAPVKLAFNLARLAIVGVVGFLAIGWAGWRPFDGRGVPWGAISMVVISFWVLGFVQSEVHRMYGKRALLEREMGL
jgi:hypothetical protein